MTRTPHHSKKKKSTVHGLPITQAAVGGFFIIWYVHIGRYASFVYDSLVVMVIAISMPFSYAFSFSGSIFRKLLCRSFFSKFPVSFSCFSHFCIIDLETLKT